MLTIRLSRIGKKNKPMYRLIISEKARDPFGKALEILGSYNPYTKALESKTDRITYWISKGAQLSPSVNNLLLEKGVIKGEKVKTFKINTDKQVKKREERSKTEKEAAEKAKAEAAAAVVEEKTEVQAPAEAEATPVAPKEEAVVETVKPETAQ